MSWLYLPEQAAVSSPPTGSSDTASSATSRMTPTASRSSKPASGTASSTTPQSGTTPVPSTGDPGADAWISSLRASRASHLPKAVNGKGQTTTATSGLTPFALLEKSSLSGSSWRIPQSSYLPSGHGEKKLTSTPFSETWPEAGTTQNGVAYQLPPLELTTKDDGYGLLPTPVARDGHSFYVNTKETALKRIKAIRKGGSGRQIHWMQYSVVYHGLSKGWANPRFSELMMGWPIGWTDLKPLAMAKFQQWLLQHGGCSVNPHKGETMHTIITDPNKEHVTAIQSRAEMNFNLIDEYAAEMKRGVDFYPAKAIFSREDNHFYIYDGAHRLEASKTADANLKIAYEYGTRADAEWLALAANTKHGLRRSRADKQRVTKNALLTKPELSDRKIAIHCGVDHKTVGKHRADLETSGEIPQIAERTVTRNGQTFTQAAKATTQCANCNTPNPGLSWNADDDEAHLYTLCKSCHEKAKTTPAYATITDLESHVRGWLGGLHDQSLIPTILSEIKEHSEEGKQRLSEISDYVKRRGDAPHRPGDLRQACNNVLTQNEWQQKRNDHIATLICHNCGEQTLVAIDGNAIHCTTCGDEWNCVAHFEREATCYNNTEKQAKTTIPAGCSVCQADPSPGDTLYPLDDGSFICHKCKKTQVAETITSAIAEAAANTEHEARIKAMSHIGAIPCPECTTIGALRFPDDYLGSIQCPDCHVSWQDVAALEQAAATMRPRCTLHTYDPTDWVNQHTQDACPSCLRALGYVMIQDANEGNDSTPPDHIETADMRLALKQRFRELIWAIPDKDLPGFETWITSVETMMTPDKEPT